MLVSCASVFSSIVISSEQQVDPHSCYVSSHILLIKITKRMNEGSGAGRLKRPLRSQDCLPLLYIQTRQNSTRGAMHVERNTEARSRIIVAVEKQ